ncbi:UNKNOWN [Stylonychia lemnae]|uniref:C2 domain-containing protein n=1 Tax=Stylonychia lemnae TaxID=5949 RepID=A0A078B3J0_STYLE|nr:UNKNOWN [Stylonychia lemnae]|eukprot:CDW89014.1 UNKNOWN [Stylonychia lemnae]
MELAIPLFMKKDKSASSDGLLNQSNNEISKEEQVQQNLAQDSTLQIKISSIQGLNPADYERDELDKCYIRILLDDDNYNTGFGKVSLQDNGLLDIEWEESIYVKVGNDKDVASTQIYIIICINNEKEISYLDKMISTYEMNLIDYSDQRSRMIQYDVEDENKIGERGSQSIILVRIIIRSCRSN